MGINDIFAKHKVKKRFMKTSALPGIVLAVFVGVACGLPALGQDNKIVIGEKITMQSTILKEERSLQISTPSGYEKSLERYPVIFVLDGEGQFAQAVGAVHWLGKVNKMPPAIVVGIPNTNRNRDLTPPISNPAGRNPGGGRADRFLSFLTGELKPYIDKHYRTRPFSILFGHSLGGIFVFHTFLNSPDAFSAYIAGSPALWWNDQSLIRKAQEVFDANPDRRGLLFFSHGQEVALMTKSITRLAQVLRDRSQKNLDWKFKVFAEENHESAGHMALYKGLEFIYQGWRFDFAYLYKEFNPENKVFTAGVLIDHFKKLTDKYGYDCRPAEFYYNSVGYDLLRQKSIASAIELFKANVLFYPESANTYDSLAEAYMIAGNKKKAMENYEKSLKLDPGNTNAAKHLQELKK